MKRNAWMMTTCGCLLLASGVAVWAGNSDEKQFKWTTASYKTTEPKDATFTEIATYHYRESVLQPVVTVAPVSKVSATYDTPEHAMVARLSAMMSLDYDWWFETWDAKAQKQIQEDNTRLKRGPEKWKSQWQIFKAANVQLVRRIEIQQYRVLTYVLIGKDGTTKTPELVTVFQKDGNKWLATFDLKESDLLAAAPWITGKSEVRLTVR